MELTGRWTWMIPVTMLLSSAGCVQPPDPLEVGVKEIATDIILASKDEQPQGPDVAGRFRIGVGRPPTFSIPPVAVGAGPKTTGKGPREVGEPVEKCPGAEPGEPATMAAPPRPADPPAPGTYLYRIDGSYAYDGEIDERGRYPALSARTIRDVRDIDGGYSFTIEDDLGVTTGYSIYPRQRVAEDDPTHVNEASHPVEAGIFVNRISMKRADGSTVELLPQPELRVATLPLVKGQKFESTSVDPVSGITIRLNGQIGLGETFDPFKARVDACGDVLEGYWVMYTVDTTFPVTSTTRLFGTDIDLEFAGTKVVFGTQYGGIPLQEIVTIKGSDGGTTVKIERTATIMSEPRS